MEVMVMVLCRSKAQDRKPPRTLLLLIAAAMGAISLPAWATDYYWAAPAGTWANRLNWNPSAEPGAGDFAHLDYSSNASIQVTDPAPTVGSIEINDGDTLNLQHDGFNDGYLSTTGDVDVGNLSAGTLNVLPRGGGIIFTGQGHLAVGATMYVGPAGVVNQSGGSVSLSAASTLAMSGQYNLSGGTLNVPGLITDAGTFTISGGNLTNAATISVSSALAFNGGSFFSGSLVISRNAQMHLGAGGGKVVHVSNLQIKSGGIDLTDNALIDDDSTAFPTIVNLIRTGTYSGITQTYTGLISSTAIISGGSAHPTSLGFALASNLGINTFEGQSVNPDSTLVRYTYSGDTNLDGTVNALDFNLLATNYGAAGKYWMQGDFNQDGIVNSPDFDLLALNYNKVMPSSASLPLAGTDSTLGVPTPEPQFLSLIVLMLPAFRHRRV